MSYVTEDAVTTLTSLVTLAADIDKNYNKNKGRKLSGDKDNYGLKDSSIFKASKDLIMSFPVLCSDAVSPSTAMMVTKAIERLCVQTLQMLFASSYMNGEDGREVIRHWHQNMRTNVDMNDVIDAIDATNTTMNTLYPDSPLFSEGYNKYNPVLKALKERYEILPSDQNRLKREFLEQSTMYYDDISSFGESLTEYSINRSSEGVSIKEEYIEEKRLSKPDLDDDIDYEERHGNASGKMIGFSHDGIPHKIIDYDAYGNPIYNYDVLPNSDKIGYDTVENINLDREKFKYQREKDKKDRYDQYYKYDQDYEIFKYQKINDKRNRAEKQRQFNKQYNQKDSQFDRQMKNYDREYNYRSQQDAIRNRQSDRMYQQQRLNDRNQYYQKQLLDSDVKKANELVPSTMVVRYFSNTESGEPIETDFIAGVKARLISCPEQEIIDHIASTKKTAISFTNFIRATTGEIKFGRDFVAAVDQAKIDAKTNSKISKTSPIWRMLQDRSTHSTISRLKKDRMNKASAITSLVITQEEANLIKNEYNMDMNDPKQARKIMTTYNLLMFIIIDDIEEIALFLLDNGDTYYQTYSYNALERETQDASYKKVINLLSKTALR